jgi:poly-gamma-glutamate system protein
MKKIYWRPQGTPLLGFILIGLFSIGGLIAIEHFPKIEKSPYYKAQLDSARLAARAMAVIRKNRLEKGGGIDPEDDPAHSGLIGLPLSPVTSDTGDLRSKQTSINPNFAAVIVDLLKEAGAKEGDRVAVSMSGSFPALNIAVCAAIQTLNLNPTIITSVAASQWGANNPEFLWIDMENLLYKEGIFSFRAVAASIGGRGDIGKDMSEAGRNDIIKAIQRNGLTLIFTRTREENIEQRMSIYYKDGSPAIYINVGGAVAAIGARWRWRHFIKPGLMTEEFPESRKGDFLVYRFLKEGIPVIHLEDIKKMAAHYGLPLAPHKIPAVGEGDVYYTQGYNLWLTGLVLGGILCGLYIFSHTDIGFRMFQIYSHREESGPPEPMA